MNKVELVKRTRLNLNDVQNPLFRDQDIVDYMNEAIDRVKQIIPSLYMIEQMVAEHDTPNPLPVQYHHLLSVYATSRCSSQDQRHYEGSLMMNEFETKLNGLADAILNGEVIVVDEFGDPYDVDGPSEYVKNIYFDNIRIKNREW